MNRATISSINVIGGPVGVRTRNQPIKSRLLYPIELPVQRPVRADIFVLHHNSSTLVSCGS